ncbi:MAG: Hsp20/alpha crystallin family protein [Clostridiales bacterium]|nr:Hsp20/alpha crystallin family protein [Clostridiales bacterium]
MLLPRFFSNNLFDDFFNDDLFTRPVASKTMNADIKEYDDKYELKLELPGYEKDNIRVNLKDGYLIVEANHTESKEEDSGKYIRRERYEGKVKRSFYVGKNIADEDVYARFVNGVLEINIPKVNVESEAKSIDIN